MDRYWAALVYIRRVRKDGSYLVAQLARRMVPEMSEMIRTGRGRDAEAVTVRHARTFNQPHLTGNMRGRIIVIQTPSCVVLDIRIWLAMTQVCIPQRSKHNPTSQRRSNPYILSDR